LYKNVWENLAYGIKEKKCGGRVYHIRDYTLINLFRAGYSFHETLRI